MTPQSHLAHLSSQFSAGRYDAVCSHYSFPLPLYLDGKPAVLPRQQDLSAFFQALHRRLICSGLPNLTGTLTSVELPRNGRFRLWADWTASGPKGCQPVMKTLCFNRGTHADHLTEMVQITDLGSLPLTSLVQAA